MEKVLNYIGGEFKKPSTDIWMDNVNPATGQVMSKVPISDQGDIERAVESAEEAFHSWSRLKNEERADWLNKLSLGIREKAHLFAEMETTDNGKPYWLSSSVDIPRSIHNLRFFAEAINQWSSESHHGSAGLNYTLRQPRGIAACISPWNLPLYLFTWKIAPALATGNTVIAKPSEVTPMTAYYLAKVAEDINFPKGVLNIIHGPGQPTGESLVSHPQTKTITFTGGTQTGRKIASLVAPMFKKYSLELGGKNPNIIFADCDFDTMLETTLRSSFANQGQICLCGSRLLIEEPIYEKFKEKFVERVKGLKVGDPMDPNTNQGAIVSKEHYEKILNAIEVARLEGGKILCGGNPAPMSGALSKGFYITPTVIEGIDPQSCTFQQEIFGPVVSIHPFKSDSEALKLANNTDYGLSATIWTEKLSRAHELASNLQAGIVWINTWLHRDLRTPFGGVGASGVGREGGHETLRFFTEPKNICIDF